MMLELCEHDHDRDTAQEIKEAEIYFQDRGPSWCTYMVSLASEIAPAINEIERAMPPMDRRHCQNMATLLAGSFVALHGRRPTETEAQALAEEFAPTTELHAEVLDRDDARECLDRLFGHVVERYPLGHWIGYDRHNQGGNSDWVMVAQRILATYGIRLQLDGDKPGLLIHKNSAAINDIFKGTRWADRAWIRALQKLDGNFATSPTRFKLQGGGSDKARPIGLPLSLIPEPLEMPTNAWDEARNETRY
jgi:hypothetical protein